MTSALQKFGSYLSSTAQSTGLRESMYQVGKVVGQVGVVGVLATTSLQAAVAAATAYSVYEGSRYVRSRFFSGRQVEVLEEPQIEPENPPAQQEEANAAAIVVPQPENPVVAPQNPPIEPEEVVPPVPLVVAVNSPARGLVPIQQIRVDAEALPIARGSHAVAVQPTEATPLIEVSERKSKQEIIADLEQRKTGMRTWNGKRGIDLTISDPQLEEKGNNLNWLKNRIKFYRSKIKQTAGIFYWLTVFWRAVKSCFQSA